MATFTFLPHRPFHNNLDRITRLAKCLYRQFMTGLSHVHAVNLHRKPYSHFFYKNRLFIWFLAQIIILSVYAFSKFFSLNISYLCNSLCIILCNIIVQRDFYRHPLSDPPLFRTFLRAFLGDICIEYDALQALGSISWAFLLDIEASYIWHVFLDYFIV